MSEKVLVIDDDEDLAELLALLMRKNGYEAQVLHGLAENDPVILHPGDRITPGAAIVPR